MPYTQPTLTEAQAALASRLNDSANVHWTAAELTTYLQESIRTWNAWTSSFRDQDSFTTVVGQAFYDLTTDLALSLRAQTLTSWNLVTDLQYALMEPPAAGGTWTGTDQFTLDQLNSAIQRRRDQFLRETGVQLTRTVTTGVTPTASGRITLDQAVFNIRRAAWSPDSTKFNRPLLRTDEWAAANFKPAWLQSTQPPSCYSVAATPPLYVQLIPPTTAVGTFDLVSINTGGSIVSSAASILGIPDDYVWILKYGALADLLGGDGLALDPQRASYCEARWKQGIELARSAPVIIDARINGVSCRIGSLADADRYAPTWQLVPGTPKELLLAGQNLVASFPPAGATGGPWTITLDLVRNAPVPSAGSDVLQISEAIYDSILDLAQHLALFKEGPGQLQTAMGLLDRATRAAGITINFQQAQHPDRAAIMGQTEQDRRAVAEQQSAIPIPVEG